MKLVRTSGCAPEQYNLIDEGETLGYLRLRHGYFTVHLYGPSGPVVYESNTMMGDGCFEPKERDYYLQNAVAAIIARIGISVVDSDDY